MKERTTAGDVVIMQSQTYYQRLGVEPTAEADVIKRAYRKCCRRYHPDKAHVDDVENATKCMQMVSGAHAVVGDPMKRSTYDRWLESNPGTDQEFNENDMEGINPFAAIILIILGLAMAGFELSRARVPALWHNAISVLASPSPRLRPLVNSLPIPGLRGTAAFLWVLWFLGVGEGLTLFGENEAIEQLDFVVRLAIGVGAILTMMLSLLGAADPRQDDIYWWDTWMTTGLFGFWFWTRGGSLVPSVVWSYTCAFLLSVFIDRIALHDEAELRKLFNTVRHLPLQTLGLLTVVFGVSSGLFYVQYAYWSRAAVAAGAASAVVYCGAKLYGDGRGNAPLLDDTREKYWVYVQLAVAVAWGFSWRAMGILWTVIIALVWLLATAAKMFEPSLRGTVLLGLFVVVAWPLAWWTIYSGTTFLVHGGFWDTLQYAIGLAVVWPLLRGGYTWAAAFIETEMTQVDDDAAGAAGASEPAESED